MELKPACLNCSEIYKKYVLYLNANFYEAYVIQQPGYSPGHLCFQLERSNYIIATRL